MISKCDTWSFGQSLGNGFGWELFSISLYNYVINWTDEGDSVEK